ncbi:MAG: hypothetical protein JSU05_06005 [Bacteroidetes bacterium]|nr:hypothetical protein [Bacteroidota bacterium]
MKRANFSAALVTGVLLLYCMLILLEAPLPYILTVFIALPVLLAWMVYTVIRHGTYRGAELAEDEEWGYQDKNKDELGLF